MTRATLVTLTIAEPTYRDAEHAPINAAFTTALPATCLACTSAQYDALCSLGMGPALPPHAVIHVLPPGGVTFRRMHTQWRALSPFTAQSGVTRLLLLSAGPETLFVARMLVIRRPDLHIHAVMHNMSSIAGWRSRDPRRRWIDMQAALRWANHPRIHLVVLEHYIAAAAAQGGPSWPRIANTFKVWPHPTLAHEHMPPAAWAPGDRLRLTIPGVASRDKGFDTILALAAASPQHDWYVTGRLGAEYRDAAVSIPSADGRLSRPAYLAALRRADYAVLAHQPDYDLTASGSILDCVTNGIPLIALASPAVTALSAEYGPLGYIVPDRAAAEALLHNPVLRDSTTYAGFQRSMRALHNSRTPAALAPLLRRDLGLPI